MDTGSNKDRRPGEKIVAVPLASISPFADHPFRVEQDAEMQALTESILESGVMTPAIVRPKGDGTYEMISGHRRMAACRELGLEKMPVVIRDLDDDTAALMVVDANRQRERILPSEKAFAYRLRMEVLSRRGGSGKTRDAVSDKESGRQVQRYIRLTYLLPQLLKLVDDGRMGLNPAVELSYLTPEEQQYVLTAIESEQATPSLTQAKELRELSVMEILTEDEALNVLLNGRGKEPEKLMLPMGQIERFFPRDATPRQMLEEIVSLLEQRDRQRRRSRDLDR